MKRLGKILKGRREELGITLREIADIVGLGDRQHAWATETGRRGLPKGKRRAYLLAVGLKLRDVEEAVKDDLWEKWKQ